MAIDSDTVQRLLDQLAKDRQEFIDTTAKTHDLLQQTLLALNSLSKQQSQPPRTPVTLDQIHTQRRPSAAIGYGLTNASQRVTTADIEVESIPQDRSSASYPGDSDSESDHSESVFVQTPLQPEEYTMEGLRNHIWDYGWTDQGKAILCGLNEDGTALSRDCILPITQAEAELDRSHLSHYSIYDIGFDGVPLDIQHSGDRTRAMQIWNRIRTTNMDPEKRVAAGRIVIVREPSPKLFAALHYTMNKHFDVDEMFGLLEDENPGLMFPHRAFDSDTRHRRSFVITMEYFTIIGDNCKPMKWQSADEEHGTDMSVHHIPISRCSSVVGLSLEGSPMTKVKNRDRRILEKYGDVFDPFSPWRVLSIQAYPDWYATTDTHKPTSHYVNGPEAFIHTVQAEFIDARKRLKEVYARVGELVEPPHNFIFNSKVREALLFEDDKFTYSKRYFWAYQTLSIINQDITEMIESYRDTFRDSVWEGTNKIIWPGDSSVSSRYQHWRRRMAKLRQVLDDEVNKLEHIKTMNYKKMQDIEALRENLFSGTSVMESRRSVEQTLVTVEQNRSVLLLTLVTIFFLPLTFVTSVFGMTNMDPKESETHFGWTVLAICIPTYMIIGSLHSDAGLNFWRRNKNLLVDNLGKWLARFLALFGYAPGWTKNFDPRHKAKLNRETAGASRKLPNKRLSSTVQAAMNARMQSMSPDDLAPSMSRLSTRDKYTPRPQLASGDAQDATSMDAPSRTKSRTGTNEIRFSVERMTRVQSPAIIEESGSGSLSPRTSSPGRNNKEWSASNKALRTGTVAKSRGWLSFGRLWWRKDSDNRNSPRSPRPSV